MEITPFTIDIPDTDIRDLRARLANTRWPWDVADDWSRGVPTSVLRPLAERWADAFDWPARQAALNALPQFTTEIDGQTFTSCTCVRRSRMRRRSSSPTATRARSSSSPG